MGFPSNASIHFYCQTKRAFTGELVATVSGRDTDTTCGCCDHWYLLGAACTLHHHSSLATFVLWPSCTCSSESKAINAVYKLLKCSTGLQLLRQTPTIWCQASLNHIYFSALLKNYSQHSKKLTKKTIIYYTY